MDNKEKILLIQCLLQDIRGNWGWDNGHNREKLALDLALELKEVPGMEELAQEIREYEGDDGRYFRSKYPRGYGDMEELHQLSFTLKDKSKEFRDKALKYLTYPENRFSDI